MKGHLHLLCLAAIRLPIATQAGLEAAGLHLARLVHERPGKSLSAAHLKQCHDVEGFKNVFLISTSEWYKMNYFFFSFGN